MMQIPSNQFRKALRLGQAQIGLWVGLADANAAEAPAGCGFDWLLLDGVKQPGMGREGSMHGIEEYVGTNYLCMGGA